MAKSSYNKKLDKVLFEAGFCKHEDSRVFVRVRSYDGGVAKVCVEDKNRGGLKRWPHSLIEKILPLLAKAAEFKVAEEKPEVDTKAA